MYFYLVYKFNEATKKCCLSMEGFTRQETLALTRTTSNRLSYVYRTQVAIPYKYGNPKKPTVIYTWEQVLEIQAIRHLKQEISLQRVRKIIQILQESGFDDSLRDEHLVVVNDEMYWMMGNWLNMPQMMKVSDNENKYQRTFVLIVILQLVCVIQNFCKEADKSKIIDFGSLKRRSKVKPLIASKLSQ